MPRGNAHHTHSHIAKPKTPKAAKPARSSVKQLKRGSAGRAVGVRKVQVRTSVR